MQRACSRSRPWLWPASFIALRALAQASRRVGIGLKRAADVALRCLSAAKLSLLNVKLAKHAAASPSGARGTVQCRCSAQGATIRLVYPQAATVAAEKMYNPQGIWWAAPRMQWVWLRWSCRCVSISCDNKLCASQSGYLLTNMWVDSDIAFS